LRSRDARGGRGGPERGEASRSAAEGGEGPRPPTTPPRKPPCDLTHGEERERAATADRGFVGKGGGFSRPASQCAIGGQSSSGIETVCKSPYDEVIGRWGLHG